MKVIIPLAGLGTRLRPHTLSRPKPLMSVAGKPVLGHVLDRISVLDIREMIFITGYLGEQIEEYVRKTYRFPSRFVEQRDLMGQAHAIHLAREFIDDELLIIFVDTICELDFSAVLAGSVDGVLFVKEVDDPRRFGVAVVQDGYVTRLVEKPKTPVSNLAVVGVYYLRNWQLFVECLGELLARKIKTNDEYYLADALQLMINRGARLTASAVEVWEDTGTPEALLQANRYLLGKDGHRVEGELVNSLVVPPAYVSAGTRLINSVVGPNVSVGENAVIQDSTLRDCIVGEETQISSVVLANSLIGSRAIIQACPQRLNVSDYSYFFHDMADSLS